MTGFPKKVLKAFMGVKKREGERERRKRKRGEKVLSVREKTLLFC